MSTVAALAVSAYAKDEPLVINPGTTAERRPHHTRVPEYPRKAREQRREGEVVVCYTINADGRVSRPVVESSSDRIFNRAALKAIKSSRYLPAEPGAANERTHACSTYRFVLTPVAGARDAEDGAVVIR